MWVTFGLQAALLGVVALAMAASLWLPLRVLVAQRRRRLVAVARPGNVVELAAWRARRR
jgi:hypothetical protein